MRISQCSRSWIALYFAVLVFLLGSLAIFNFRQDPFTMFRRDGLFLTSNKFQRYTNAGLTKTAGRVEALVVGNSYIANVNPTLVEKLFGLKTTVHSQWGLAQGEMNTATEFAMALHPEIKMVFFQVPIWDTCSTQPHPATPLPKALYRGYPWALVSYLLSEETTAQSISKLDRTPDFKADPAAIYRWWETSSHLVGKSERLTTQLSKAPAVFKKRQLPKAQFDKMVSDTVACFRDFATTFTSAHPDTQFVFFNPPHFQWLLWYRDQTGVLQPQISAMEQIARFVSTLRNALYFDFYAAEDWISDCRHWRDLSHFDLEVSDGVIAAMAEGDFERTPTTNAALSARIRKAVSRKAACS